MSEAIGIVERLNDLRLAAFRAGGFDTPAAKAYYRALSTAFQRDELVDAAEISRLTARIAELEMALKPFVDEFKACRDSYIRRYPRHPAVGADNFDKMPDDWPMETSDFSMGVFRFARTTLEASERGGGE